MPQSNYPFIPFIAENVAPEVMQERSLRFFEWMDRRRTVRDFTADPIPEGVIENLIRTASTAPSGAHKQPWTFCIVRNPELKKKIREAAEKEEYESYTTRMPQDWLDDLAPIGTDWNKPFLETAPVLIVVFKRSYEFVNGRKKNNYYVTESVGLACGFLLAAIHNAGLVALTHTPSPMNFLSDLLGRPENEKPFLLIPVGYAAPEAKVPELARKPLEAVAIHYK